MQRMLNDLLLVVSVDVIVSQSVDDDREVQHTMIIVLPGAAHLPASILRRQNQSFRLSGGLISGESKTDFFVL